MYTDELVPVVARQLLDGLLSLKKGDFSVRMPSHLIGVDGKIADCFNEVSELNQRMNEFALQLQGPRAPLTDGSNHVIADGRWQYGLLRSRGNTIEEGTSEIQRGIIAERLLGLPKGY